MSKIVPTILTSDQNQYKSYIDSYNTFAKRVQIDISDGQFTPTTALPETSCWWPKGWIVDFHMMVVRPSEHLANIIKLRPSLCIFHAETGEDLLPIFAELKKNNIKTGVAMVRNTYPGYFKPVIEAADHALIFAGELGRQGSEADLLQTEKAKLIRKIKPSIEIGWDGGANLKNVRTIAHADIDIINVGSAIATAPDPAAAQKELQAESEKRGIAL